MSVCILDTCTSMSYHIYLIYSEYDTRTYDSTPVNPL